MMTKEQLLGIIVDKGEVSLTNTADSTNIPVNICIEEQNGEWHLWASNYLPRKGTVHSSVYKVIAPERKFLVEAIRLYIVPLYENVVPVNDVVAVVKKAEDDNCQTINTNS